MGDYQCSFLFGMREKVEKAPVERLTRSTIFLVGGMVDLLQCLSRMKLWQCLFVV